METKMETAKIYYTDPLLYSLERFGSLGSLVIAVEDISHSLNAHCKRSQTGLQFDKRCRHVYFDHLMRTSRNRAHKLLGNPRGCTFHKMVLNASWKVGAWMHKMMQQILMHTLEHGDL